MRSRMAGKRRKRGLPLLLAFCMGLGGFWQAAGARGRRIRKRRWKKRRLMCWRQRRLRVFHPSAGNGLLSVWRPVDSDGRLLL